MVRCTNIGVVAPFAVSIAARGSVTGMEQNREQSV